MSLRKKLRLNGEEEDEVTLHVPPADPAAELYQKASTLSEQLKALLDERNVYKQRCETLIGQLDSLHRTLNQTANEREQYRRLAFRMIHANGKLKSTVDGIEGLFRNIRNTSAEVEHLVSQLPPEEQPPAPIDLDAHLVQQHQNPTPEEIEQIRDTLARLPQK